MFISLLEILKISKREHNIYNSNHDPILNNLLLNSDFEYFYSRNSNFEQNFHIHLHSSPKLPEYIQVSRKSRNVFTDREEVAIYRTVFVSCSSPKRGGAVYVQNDYTTMKLMNNGFFNCSSKFTNGALFFRGRESIGRYNCYDTCTGKMAGNLNSQAFIILATNKFLNSLNYTSLIACSPLKSRGRDTPGSIMFGICIFYNCNSSYNHMLSKTCGFMITESDENSITKLNYFYNNTGFSTFNEQDPKHSHQMSYCNFIRNELSSIGSVVLIHENHLFIYKVIFANNNGKLISTVANSQYTLDSCVFDLPLERLLIPKNIIINNCKFNDEDITFNDVPSFARDLCWNNCGNNKNCIHNMIRQKYQDFIDIVPTPEDDD